jgi:hypothetical protein
MRPSLPAYLSYLLRLWRTDSQWHVSLTDPVSGERTGFASIERMVVFLHRQMNAVTSSSDIETGTDSQKGKEQ